MPQKLWKYIPSIPDEIELPDKSIIELFRETASKFQDLPLTYFEGKYKTYKEVTEDINRLANGLRDLGIKKGDRVAAFLPNSPQFIVTFLAVDSLGAIFTGISSLCSQKELQYQLEDSGAKAIITFDVFLDKVRKVKKETSLEHIIVTSAADELSSIKAFLYKLIIGRKNPKVKNEIKYKELIKQSSNEPIITKVNPKEDIAILQYTGGTTGVMKGAMLTHRNLVAQAITLDYWKNWLKNVPEKQRGIVVVDNNSPNKEGFKIKKMFGKKRGMEFILLKRNYGFSKANNVGAELAIKKYNPSFLYTCTGINSSITSFCKNDGGINSTFVLFALLLFNNFSLLSVSTASSIAVTISPYSLAKLLIFILWHSI